jgi:hypothetical protein
LGGKGFQSRGQNRKFISNIPIPVINIFCHTKESVNDAGNYALKRNNDQALINKSIKKQKNNDRER